MGAGCLYGCSQVVSVFAAYALPGVSEGSSVIMNQAVEEQKTNPLNAPEGFAAPQPSAADQEAAPAANDSAAQ